MKPIPLPGDVEAFMARFAGAGDCLEWQGAKNGGYGWVTIDGSQYFAHRVVWTIRHGPIPEGVRVLHTCDNPPCAAEAHLYLGTMKDNSRDMVTRGRHGSSVKTHCPRGHPYTEENTYRFPDGRRWCRTCHRATSAAWRRDKRKA